MGRNTMYLSPIASPDCCKDCKPPKRNPYCHSECPEYLEARQEREKEIEQYRKEHKGKKDALNLEREGIDKTRRSHHNHRRLKRSK